MLFIWCNNRSVGFIKIVYETYRMYPSELSNLFNINSKYFIAIKNTLDFYLKIQLSDNNMPTNTHRTCASNYGTDPDAEFNGSLLYFSLYFSIYKYFSSLNFVFDFFFFLVMNRCHGMFIMEFVSYMFT